jgi:hypothetical protein
MPSGKGSIAVGPHLKVIVGFVYPKTWQIHIERRPRFSNTSFVGGVEHISGLTITWFLRRTGRGDPQTDWPGLLAAPIDQLFAHVQFLL